MEWVKFWVWVGWIIEGEVRLWSVIPVALLSLPSIPEGEYDDNVGPGNLPEADSVRKSPSPSSELIRM